MAEKCEVLEATTAQEWTPVELAILERRSVRKYKDRQVPEDLVRRILEAGRYAPSAGNCQPWKFLVVRDRAMLDEMERDVVMMCKFFRFFLDWRLPGILSSLRWLYAQLHTAAAERPAPDPLRRDHPRRTREAQALPRGPDRDPHHER